MNDPQATQQNEQLLEQFLGSADKKFAGQVALTSLALLTEQMAPDQYQQFLSDCIENAHEIQLHRSMNARQPKQQQPQEQAAPSPGAPQNGGTNGTPSTTT